MKKLRKIVALFLAMILALGNLSITAFASETGGENTIPENAERHTIEVTLEPGENLESSVASTWNYGSGDYSLVSGSITYVPIETDCRYMAFETSALGPNGTALNEYFKTQLMLPNLTTTLASVNTLANGYVEKVDWLDFGAGNYVFKITNNTSVTITVTIVYYSWA